MPELPEVETIRRDLQTHVSGLTIRNVEVFDSRVIAGQTPESFIRRLRGKTMMAFDRRGKSLIITLKPRGFLVIQPKMSGYVIYHPSLKRADQTAERSKLKAVFELSNKSALHYNDHRMFGKLYGVDDLSSVKHLNQLGPEPLAPEFTAAVLTTRLRRTTPVKVALMNQELVAGIGNIYASEILFDAGIDPRRPSRSLAPSEIRRLHRSIPKILKQAIRMRGSSLRDYRDTSGQKGDFVRCIRVYNRAGESCLRCGHKIQSIVQAQRSTFFCGSCQK